MDTPRASREPINFTRLRQEPPPVFLLGPRDILGIYIEGVLGKPDEPPPVHFPVDNNTPPSIGFPIPVREDGTLSLPLIPPITVTGLTIAQAEHEIREAYTVTNRILQPEHARIIVTMMKPRSYNILVVREDTPTWGYSGSVGVSRSAYGFEPERRGNTKQVQLPAYENDVLHAMVESGGLPGVDSKNQITILRGAIKNPALQEQYQRSISDPVTRAQLFASGAAIKIPLRLGPGDPPFMLNPDDVLLNTGDIIFVESRSAEVFYTGGLLPGKQIPVPRDYDLDVLGAIAMAGGQIASGAGANPTNLSRATVGSLFPPTRVVVIRNVDGQMKSFKLSLKTAVTDPRERILIQPNDFVILEYTEYELFMNVMLNNVNLNFSLNELFN
jgi:protein involved in polysaccharide export with SLBB domain